MGDVVDFQSKLSAHLTLSEEEIEILKWEPFAVALYEEIVSLKEEFGADDEVLVRVLRVLVEGFAADCS